MIRQQSTVHLHGIPEMPSQQTFKKEAARESLEQKKWMPHWKTNHPRKANIEETLHKPDMTHVKTRERDYENHI